MGDSGLADLLLCAALMASFRKELDSIIRCSEEMLDLLSSEEDEEEEKALLVMSLLLVLTSFLPMSSSFSLLLSSLKRNDVMFGHFQQCVRCSWSKE